MKNFNMKKSSYLNLFLSQDNEQDANKMANFCTDNHSKKIKSGNRLENFICQDISSNTKINCLQNKKIEDLNELTDGIYYIQNFRVTKKFYQKYGIKISNKTCNVIDICFCTKNDNTITISFFELKSGTDFDTKKSKGEITTLMNTKKILEKEGFNVEKVGIVFFQAEDEKEIKFKADLQDVEKLLYENFAKILEFDGVESRKRIEGKLMVISKKNINEFKLSSFDILSYDLLSFLGSEKFNELKNFMNEKYK
jgi:hypothetical protein